MKVAELIKELKRFPDDMEVGLTDFDEPISACFDIVNLKLNETFGLCIINFGLEGEQRIMEKGVEVWLARDEDGWLSIFNDRPCTTVYRGIVEWKSEEGKPGGVYIRPESLSFPEVTYKNSPVKARIILED